MTCSVSIATSQGEFTAHFSNRGLARLDFPGRKHHPDQTDATMPAARDLRRWQKLTTDALRAALIGAKPGELPPFDWHGATPFQQSIWRELKKIPPGQTSSYAELATAADHPRAARATGGACGANPIPILVPCHRVLAAGGRIGGFSGGLDWKRRLLASEGHHIRSAHRA